MNTSLRDSLVSLDSISFRYPKSDSDALSDVSLEIPQGSFFALLGPNGAGKTTMLRLLCGRFSKFSGSLSLAADIRGGNGYLNPLVCGVLLENPGIYPKLSIAEYIDYFVGFYAARSTSWNEAAARERIAGLARKLELPSLSTRLSALSLGNRQKVQLLRAMAPNPRLLILDEPVANLDPMSRETVWSLLDEWRKKEKGTAIVCSHILAEMEKEATDYAIINHGRVLKSGRVADLLDDSKTFKVETPAGVTLEQVNAALKSAGINASVNPMSANLSKLYREIIA